MDDAIEHLAKRLHWKMEHLDPTEDPDWDLLTERQRDFYRLCIKSLLAERSAIEEALQLTAPAPASPLAT
jgi:hypothetical protein